MSIPPELRALARQQHLLVTRQQALEAGLSEASIDRRVKSGEWERMHAAVYRVDPLVPPSPDQRLLATCLAIPGAVVSHRAAAWLWGLLDPFPGVVDVTLGRVRRPLAGVVVHWTRDQAGLAVSHRRHIPVTNPLRTLVDLAAVTGTSDLGVAIDCALRARLVTGVALLAELDRRGHQGVQGVAALRRALEQRGIPGVPASALERRMMSVVRAHGLPEPARELPVGPGHRYRADLGWPAAGLLVEVDGLNSHGTAQALQADLARQNDLVTEGWRVLRYTWADLRDRPGHVSDEIGRLLSASAVSDSRSP
ncbi:MAG: type IV toxin-antitoxin system AbiEi family antitoxin domain-containing protein, partial [Acidimicrobiales bacterium]